MLVLQFLRKNTFVGNSWDSAGFNFFQGTVDVWNLDVRKPDLSNSGRTPVRITVFSLPEIQTLIYVLSVQILDSSSGFQTLSKIWTLWNPDDNHASEIWTSPVFRNSLYEISLLAKVSNWDWQQKIIFKFMKEYT